MSMSEPEGGNPCFGCGDASPRGMHLRFDRDEQRQRIVGKFRLGPEYQGATGFIHGGIIILRGLQVQPAPVPRCSTRS